ncbi:MAG: hypothetical protein JW712_03540 [Dehalococcoidales bacterium]|nr:hypothetical protein [Dehalococcoidales bacterium]
MNKHHRIHLFGASGSGTTTLGISLAERLGVPHLDTDDFFWIRTEIPYTAQRPPDERAALLRKKLSETEGWVLSGSLCGWGDFSIPLFTLAVFLRIPQDIRIARLNKRETETFGVEALAPGGWFHENHLAFLEYALSYDTAGPETRSRAMHEQWIKTLPCECLRFEKPLSIPELTDEILNHIN